MANYFYTDENGQKQGPVSAEQVKELVVQGIVKPNTLLEIRLDTLPETENGHVVEAGLIPDLFTRQSSGLFDIGFTRFISNTWISIIWVILIIVHFLAAIGATYYSFNEDEPLLFLLALFAVPISLLLCRMSLELKVIFFRIESNTRESKEHLREIKELLAQK